MISDIMEARNIIEIAEQKGLATFPSRKMGWHFDDKVMEAMDT